MRTIMINGTKVKVTPATYRKIEAIASRKKLTFSEAISYCLKKVK